MYEDNIIDEKGRAAEFEPDITDSRNAARVLEENGIRATVRRKLGADINASCGQLRRGENNQDN